MSDDERRPALRGRGRLMQARPCRYYESRPPRCHPDALPSDGLDAVLLNGAEIGARHRAQVRLAAQRARSSEGERELAQHVLGLSS